MPGEGGPGSTCGTVKTVVACRSRCGADSTMVRPHYCKSPKCGTCAPLWLDRAAVRAEERMRAAQALFLHRDPRHFSFSPPQAWAASRLRERGVAALPGMYRSLYAILRKNGLRGGVVVFHPWRCGPKCGTDEGPFKYRARSRYLAPHFHVVGFGYFKPSSGDFYKETGWVYKNLDGRECKRCGRRNKGDLERCYRCREILPERNVRSTIWYLLEHAGLNVSGKRVKDALRYYGTVHQLRVVEKRTIEEEVRCACGEVMVECEPRPDDPMAPGEELGQFYSIQVLRVYARGARARKPKGAPDLYYSIASEAPELDPTEQVTLGAVA